MFDMHVLQSWYPGRRRCWKGAEEGQRMFVQVKEKIFQIDMADIGGRCRAAVKFCEGR